MDGAFQEAMASRLSTDTDEETVDLMRNMILFGSDKGMDERMALPQVPDDWVDPEPKTDQGEPIFKDVDNPGKWSSFNYRPIFDKDKQYNYHALSTGCIRVKENCDRKRMTG